MIKDGYGGVKMCRVQPGQTMSTAAPRRHGDMQLVRHCLCTAENLGVDVSTRISSNDKFQILNMTFENLVGVVNI